MTLPVKVYSRTLASAALLNTPPHLSSTYRHGLHRPHHLEVSLKSHQQNYFVILYDLRSVHSFNTLANSQFNQNGALHLSFIIVTPNLHLLSYICGKCLTGGRKLSPACKCQYFKIYAKYKLCKAHKGSPAKKKSYFSIIENNGCYIFHRPCSVNNNCSFFNC